ncbi:MAG: nitrilase-related carbon-nitrogen hydrolase, partial [Bacteroidota bacterium]
MKNDLRTALVQTYLHWENPAANRMHLAGWLEQIKPGEADLVVLPEVFTTGFSMAASRIAEPFSGSMDTLQWMRVWASQLDAVITGSVAVIEQGKCYNRLLWVRPDGTFTHYDKRHLFRMAAEDQSYTAGQERIIEEWRGWKICPLICYDLRFPVWSRNGMVSGEPLYDVLIYIANWPSARRDPW